MRQGQQNRRGRGRGRKVQNPLSRTYESNGPDIKVRGNASHIAEKYMALSRDASASGDSVMAENYLQHAEHYNRLIMAAQGQAQSERANGVGVAPSSVRRPGAEQPSILEDGQSGSSEEADVPDSEAGESGAAAIDAPRPRKRRPRSTNGSRREGSRRSGEGSRSAGEAEAEAGADAEGAGPESVAAADTASGDDEVAASGGAAV